MKVRIALPVAAEDAAVRITFCALPEVRLRVAGLAVTPLGRPVIATATVPEKPLIALAVTLTAEPVAPAVRASDVGARVREKLGVGATVETVSATLAVWLRSPKVPVKVGVALPAAAEDAAVRVTF